MPGATTKNRQGQLHSPPVELARKCEREIAAEFPNATYLFATLGEGEKVYVHASTTEGTRYEFSEWAHGALEGQVDLRTAHVIQGPVAIEQVQLALEKSGR